MNYVWLDCDPVRLCHHLVHFDQRRRQGHDDATAILLALHSTNIRLLGVSTVRRCLCNTSCTILAQGYFLKVHGNTAAENTKVNAARCLHAFAAPGHVKVYPGAAAPLLRPARHDSEIHGPGGLGGVEGLPLADSEAVRARIDDSLPAVEAMAAAIGRTWNAGEGVKVTVVATGPLTNVALFVSVYPRLLSVAVERIVFMGGGIGVGNRSAVAEFNILCDPEAAQIVLNATVPKTMIPLNVTHKAIVTDSIHNKLLNPTSHEAHPGVASSPLRQMLSTLVHFVREKYKLIFGFMDGPPLHDALTIGYVSHPELFIGRRHRVDVELAGTHTSGETVADVWGYLKSDDTWGRTGRNCEVATDLDVTAFFDLLLGCVARCDEVSPLNLGTKN
ncbi:Inosine/uridine-preferring nucleoside hydrolase domain-containing protein [Russula earlei]|uniref:Inosine/uridine-preferring nucleoside hydrolase domain-containing protein n=1 Tax=Russula earlei TaxID=71964 RepID=A0ACC0UNG4_9AGAM|nr:Inosine/uridine-preferring nucleoside hydrolase domain-containing protein [Russula earlei]